MKKPLGSRIAKNKSVLIPLALVPAGVSLFMAVESEQAEESTIVSRREPASEVQPISPNAQSEESSTNVAVPTAINDYIGIWVSDIYDDNKMLLSSFSLDIEEISHESIEGRYCYISNYGKKEDCLKKFSGAALHNTNKPLAMNTRYAISFNSSFKNLAGKAMVELSNNNIKWELTEFPSGLGVSIPKHAVLIKENYEGIN